MLDVMLDLETMGQGPSAAITAIGAQEFDRGTGRLGESFFRVVDLASAVACGGTIDASTVLWWLRQGDDARQALQHNPIPLPLALQCFAEWLAYCGPSDSVRMWGNGAAFDNVILREAYTRLHMPTPWHWANDRCYRTLRKEHPDVALQRVGTHHNALADATSQALHVVLMTTQEAVA